ncbi:MAG: hypothetical protein FJ104_08890 [Deltaproteobacteria bacterium]|nr:hypothetical protein [Deltaproteobacteria bacterium]
MTNLPPHSTNARDVLLAAVAALDCSPPPPARLYAAADKPFGLSPWTFRRWAAEGRLRCHLGPRGKLLAWEADVRAAVEAAPYARRPPTVELAADPFRAALASGELEAARTGGSP